MSSVSDRMHAVLPRLALSFGLLLAAGAAAATNRYVVKGNVNAAPPYDTLDNAAPDIQTAINAAVEANGDRVLVAAGVYDTGGLSGYPAGAILTNRVVVNKAITVEALDPDPSLTVIEGAWHSALTPNGPAAVRAVYLFNGARLVGFTVRKGANTSAVEGNNFTRRGGGIYCPSTAAEVHGCVVLENTAQNNGGGIYSGTVYDSLIVSNATVASNGGGASGSVLYRCTVLHNSAGYYGGGLEGGSAWNSRFAYNSGHGGGGARGGDYYNCLFQGNLARSYTGGGADGTLLRLYNCTVVGNYCNGSGAGLGGGGVAAYNGASVTLVNTIVYENGIRSGATGPNVLAYGTGQFFSTNSCTTPAIAGWPAGNITNAPLFAAAGSGFGLDLVPGNYRLRGASPCVDAGLNQDWMSGATDLDGSRRILPAGGTVDLGCYEYSAPGSVLTIR